ncbi:putative bifunctional diguanylate cyclase/phosphodiesterase [Inhella sp.]|uniref:putative bifunctional diguanylate cyclase/phosphodiesterase n=1 Tax=Inhella sp. TaxID=1921806 RepID=UPI00391D3636
MQQLKHWWSDTRRLWSATDVESSEVRARHIKAMLATTPWTMLASAINLGLCAWVLSGHAQTVTLIVWALAVLAMTVAGWVGCLRIQQSHLLAVGPGTVRAATVHALLLGAVWGAMPMLWFPHAESGLQMLIAVLVTGLTCAGALALTMVPPAALTYTFIMAGLSIGALVRDGGPYTGVIQVLMVLYAIVLAVVVLAVSRLFTQRLYSERDASRQSELVGLLLRDFEESTADVLWEVDRQGRFVQPSERLATLFERPLRSMAQLQFLPALLSMQVEGSRGGGRLKAALDAGDAFRDQVVRVTTAQGPRWWSITAKPLLDEQGLPRGWRGVLSDVTSERQSNQHLAFLAHFDSLTGLANRVSVRNRLAKAVEKKAQDGRFSALLCLDLDNFKMINDSHGHSVGDAVLQEVGRRLRKQSRKSSLCGRLGGDEFAVVVDDIEDRQEVLTLADRLVVSMRAPCATGGLTLNTGVSVGVAFLPEHANTVDEALVAADLALYEAKAAGRGRVVVFSPELGKSQKRRLTLERELREALLRDQFEVLYQPQVDIQSWRIVGAEALLRWHHPELGAVSPVEFIPLAEDSGLINNMGAWVLDRACADICGPLTGLRVAVNCSAIQLQRPRFVDELDHLMRTHGVPHGALEIEVTESLLMENLSTALENLNAIKELGVRVALDDFGTGYSSLAYLRRFPFDKLKIDRAFIRELMTTSDARHIVRTILSLAKILKMDTLAEGVEEPAQLEVLARHGCSGIQGFLVARPMTANELAAMVRGWVPMRHVVGLDELPESFSAPLTDRGH